jgi:hypothetical protein
MMKGLMKTKQTRRHSKFTLRLHNYDTYLDEVGQLETILARRPAKIQIDFVGAGQIPPDTALLMRSILLGRPARTRLVTNARSSLHGGAALLWLLGDTRLIREDARLYFRLAGPFAMGRTAAAAWTDRNFFHGENHFEEDDYVRVLQLVNEFLPVKELGDQPIDRDALKQCGLVDTAKVDRFLATAFRRKKSAGRKRSLIVKKNELRGTAG